MPPGADEGNGPPQRNINLYDIDTIVGKYKIFVQKIDNPNEERKSISVLKVAEIINKITNGKNICDIKKVGRNRIIVECTDPLTANSLVQNDELKNKQLNVYIPNFLTARPAIIKNIDCDYSEEVLKTNIDSRQFKIKYIQRMNRRITREGKTEYIPSNTIKVFFHGQNIPEYIYIWNARFPCEPYVQAVKQCYKCFRYGHIARQCRNRYERCAKCGAKDHIKNECKEELPKCSNCLENHEPTDKNCRERMRQNQISELMATHNMSYHEAFLEIPRINTRQNQYSIRTENKFSVLSNYDVDFPERTKTQNIELPTFKPNPISKINWNKNKMDNKRNGNYTKKTHLHNKRGRHEESSSAEEEEGRNKKINSENTSQDNFKEIITEAIVHNKKDEDLDKIETMEDESREYMEDENTEEMNDTTKLKTRTKPEHNKKIDLDTIEVMQTENEPEQGKMETRGMRTRKIKNK